MPEFRSAAGNLVSAFELIWRAHPGSTAGMAIVTLVSAVLPAAQAYAGKLIVDGVVLAIGNVQTNDIWMALQPLLPFLLLEFIIVTVGAITSQMRALLEHVLHAKLAHTINSAIIRKSLSLDLHFFENAEFYDKLENARREADRRALDILNNGFMVLQNIITLTSFVVLLFAFSPWIALLLLGASIPLFLAQNNFSRLNFRLLTWRAPESRRMMYYRTIADRQGKR